MKIDGLVPFSYQYEHDYLQPWASFSGVPRSILVFSEFGFFKTTWDSSISTRQCIDVPSTGRVKGTSRVKSSFTRFYSTKGRVKYPSKIRVLELGFLKTNLGSILDSIRFGIYEIADISGDLAHGWWDLKSYSGCDFES